MRKRLPPPPSAAQPLLHTVPDTAGILGVGTTAIYRLIAERKLRVVYIGRSSRIPAAELARFVESLTDEAAS